MPISTVQTSVKLIQRLEKKKKDGTAPIYIRATSNRKSRYKATGISIPPKDWNKAKGQVRASHELSVALNRKLGDILHEAQRLSLDRLSAEAVQKSLGGGGSLTAYFQQHIDDLDARGAYWEHKKYSVTRNKLHAALGREELRWADLDLLALRRFMNYMEATLKNGRNTALKDYSRLGRVVKQAVRDGEIKPADNPFAYDERLPSKRVNRRKLTREEVDAIGNLTITNGVAEGSLLSLARDVFVFSFYAGGMRFSDAAKLKAQDVKLGKVTFISMKTDTPVSIPIPQEAQAIAERHSHDAAARGGYLFPMLQAGDEVDGTRLRRRISSWNAKLNVCLKTLAPMADLKPDGLSFHIARHSYADHARLHSGDLFGIGKTLGHSSVQTTEKYLRSFDQDSVDAVAREIW